MHSFVVHVNIGNGYTDLEAMLVMYLDQLGLEFRFSFILNLFINKHGTFVVRANLTNCLTDFDTVFRNVFKLTWTEIEVSFRQYYYQDFVN